MLLSCFISSRGRSDDGVLVYTGRCVDTAVENPNYAKKAQRWHMSREAQIETGQTEGRQNRNKHGVGTDTSEEKEKLKEAKDIYPISIMLHGAGTQNDHMWERGVAAHDVRMRGR